MKDGIYQVITSYLCAGFVVENGRITAIAPNPVYPRPYKWHEPYEIIWKDYYRSNIINEHF